MRNLLMVVAVAALALGGCGKKDEKKGDDKGGKGGMAAAGSFNCESVSKKNQECAGDLAAAFTAAMGDKIPADLKEKIGARMKERFSSDKWKESCAKRWDSDKPRHKAQKESMEKCFAMKDCKEYAKCFAESMGRGRMRPMKAAP